MYPDPPDFEDHLHFDVYKIVLDKILTTLQRSNITIAEIKNKVSQVKNNGPENPSRNTALKMFCPGLDTIVDK